MKGQLRGREPMGVCEGAFLMPMCVWKKWVRSLKSLPFLLQQSKNGPIVFCKLGALGGFLYGFFLLCFFVGGGLVFLFW